MDAPIIAWGGQVRDRTARTLTRGARLIVVIALVVVVFLAVLIALLRQTSDPALMKSERVNAVANDHRAVSRNTIRRSELPAGHCDDLGSQEKSQHALHSGLRRPAEGLIAPAGVNGLTDHDRAVSVQARGEEPYCYYRPRPCGQRSRQRHRCWEIPAKSREDRPCRSLPSNGRLARACCSPGTRATTAPTLPLPGLSPSFALIRR